MTCCLWPPLKHSFSVSFSCSVSVVLGKWQRSVRVSGGEWGSSNVSVICVLYWQYIELRDDSFSPLRQKKWKSWEMAILTPMLHFILTLLLLFILTLLLLVILTLMLLFNFP